MTIKLVLRSSLILVLQLLVSCSNFPNAGPYSTSYATGAYDHVKPEVSAEGNSAFLKDYILVDVDQRITNILARNVAKPFSGPFIRNKGPADIRIGRGDTVRVTIFEAGSGGLFVPSGVTLSSGNFINVPDQQVDRQGSIKVPYAGQIWVVGRRPSAVALKIEQALKNRAIEPQVVVTLPNRTSNLVTILGDVNDAGRFNITLGGDRISDIIGLAKGSKFQDYETLVTVRRGAKSATVRLSTLTRNPKYDIYLQARDIIHVKRDQRFFSFLGATQLNGQLAFDRENLTIADALAKAGGLIDERANPHTVVLYRQESVHTLHQMGAKTPPGSKKNMPTIYKIDIAKPSGFFLAKNFKMRHGDLLYVANAPIVSWTKVLNLISAHTGIASQVRSITN